MDFASAEAGYYKRCHPYQVNLSQTFVSQGGYANGVSLCVLLSIFLFLARSLFLPYCPLIFCFSLFVQQTYTCP